jgi:hypothetical protein
MSTKSLLVFSFVSIVLAMLTIATLPALAQNCSAKTCSEAIQGCMGKHCQKERTGSNCYPFCHAEFERCMQTGEFLGRVCQRKGLIKK